MSAGQLRGFAAGLATVANPVWRVSTPNYMIHPTISLGSPTPNPVLVSTTEQEIGYEHSLDSTVLGEALSNHHPGVTFFDGNCASTCFCEPGRAGLACDRITPYGYMPAYGEFTAHSMIIGLVARGLSKRNS